MQIRYDRNAFSSPDGKLRITFDNLLRCRPDFPKLIPDDQNFGKFIIPEGESIMEVKSIGAVPYWLRQRAGETGLSRPSFSKYCTSLEKHDPILRAQLSRAARRQERHRLPSHQDLGRLDLLPAHVRLDLVVQPRESPAAQRDLRPVVISRVC